MNIKCSAYMAASVDGFIARLDGNTDWLHKPEYSAPDNLSLGYEEFIASVDTLVMGRKSFENVLTFPEWPYEATPVVVLTNQDIKIPEHLNEKVKFDRGMPREVVSRLQLEGKRHLYIDGGITIQCFLLAGLITDLTITQIPIILGSGIPLFGSINVEIPLSHIETTTSRNGFVQSRYRIEHAA